MLNYEAPVRDLQFALFEVLGYEAHYSNLPGGEDLSVEMVMQILSEFSRFCEEVLVPINRSGDEDGCKWEDGQVITPRGFKEAYRLYAEGGWPSLSSDIDYGGQGLPPSLSRVTGELMGSANTGFSLYTSGQAGAIETLESFGTEQQRTAYESKLISGQWNATMCLTEPHCGTDLGLLRTKATPCADGAYEITGTKIFITGGEHDLTENIVHIVLARLPDAPIGTQGISMFVVPKILLTDDGSLGRPNNLICGSIEKKMGIKASATCEISFQGAKGYLLGEVNKGLMAMFTFMNTSRIAAAIQGVSHAELGFQKSLAYAQERLQMRSLSGAKNPDQDADPIIVHPDVRRMLLTQKALSEGNRLLVYYLAKHDDIAARGSEKPLNTISQKRLDLLTPVAKAFATETGFESANLGLQCFGGHGYIREWGMEQNVRDARIATIYEGTTGVQALDLLSRKVLGGNRDLLECFISEIQGFCSDYRSFARVERFIAELHDLCLEWEKLTLNLSERSQIDPELPGAASVNYLMYSGYVSLAYLWAQSAVVAVEKTVASSEADGFYESKLITAEFYFSHILPRTRSCVAIMNAETDSIMAMNPASFRF